MHRTLEFNIHPYKLNYRFPFRIAHTVRDHTLNAYLELIHGEHRAWGEVVFPPYYPETIESFEHFMERIDLPEVISFVGVQDYLKTTHSKVEGDFFAKAGLDTALHNLVAQIEGKSISELYEIELVKKPTSFTIGISSNEVMAQKLAFAEKKNFQYIKLKIDQENAQRIIAFYIDHCNKPFVVDANQGFTDKNIALKWCEKLANYGVDYLEQPFDKDDLKSHGWLRERSPIPIIADESFQGIHDLNRVKDAFDGINIKLMKCGGILSAYNCFQEAKKTALKTVLGCMSESSIAVNAAWKLAPLADWVDLDGPYLIKNDHHPEALFYPNV